jgi:radical SAM protein with 4Fe4S-binding SPASM domain
MKKNTKEEMEAKVLEMLRKIIDAADPDEIARQIKNQAPIPDTRCTNCPHREICPVLCQAEEVLKQSCRMFAQYNQPIEKDLPITGTQLRKFMINHRN